MEWKKNIEFIVENWEKIGDIIKNVSDLVNKNEKKNDKNNQKEE